MVVFLILVGCSKTSKLDVIGFYNAETSEYHIKNVAEDIDYEDFTVHLIVKNEKGDEKSISYDVGNLKANSEYTIDLSDMTEISEVYLYKYTYYESLIYTIIALIILLPFFIFGLFVLLDD